MAKQLDVKDAVVGDLYIQLLNVTQYASELQEQLEAQGNEIQELKASIMGAKEEAKPSK